MELGDGGTGELWASWKRGKKLEKVSLKAQ